MSQLSEFVARLEAEAEAAAARIVAVGEHFVSDLIAGAEAIGAGVEADLPSLAAQALSLVLAEAPKLLSGQEKFGNAVTGLVQIVEGKGQAIALQTAQMAIQAAFVAAKSIVGELK